MGAVGVGRKKDRQGARSDAKRAVNMEKHDQEFRIFIRLMKMRYLLLTEAGKVQIKGEQLHVKSLEPGERERLRLKEK